MKKILSFLLALGMLFSFSMTAFADASGNMYNFNCENLNYTVEYIMDDSTVTEKSQSMRRETLPFFLRKLLQAMVPLLFIKMAFKRSLLLVEIMRNMFLLLKGMSLNF